MDLSPGTLLASLVVSSIGFALFRYGKSQSRAPQLACGIAMMVFPGFVGGAAATLGTGGVLLGALWLAVRAGL